MYKTIAGATMACFARWMVLAGAMLTPAFSFADDSTEKVSAEIKQLIGAGDFTKAEAELRAQLGESADAPATTEPAIQLDLLRRIRRDFSLPETEVFEQLKREIPDVTQEDLKRWRNSGDLQARVIDGEVRYFGQAVPNLFRISEEARTRRQNAPPAPRRFDVTGHVEQLVRLAKASEEVEIFPVRHRVSYELTVNKGHARLRDGALVRAWLPFPQEYRQQRDVRLISADPSPTHLADTTAPQRTVYFERKLSGEDDAPRFRVEFEFTTSAYCPKLDASRAEPYDAKGDIFREFTAERAPHIVFTPAVRETVKSIVGDEQNPLEKARLIFRWVSQNIPWCSELEYSTIPSLSTKGLAARRGDCGVQGMTFITLCRAAGIPARWQSGWQTKPGDWNMHDWSEFYVEPWGWLPADASYGVREHDDPRVRDFFCGSMDAYRLIVNLDYGRELQPPKTSFRSEPNDFQRGEVEIDGHNLYFGEWDWKFEVTADSPSLESGG